MNDRRSCGGAADAQASADPADALSAVRGFVPPRGFRLKTSMTAAQPYWPEVWATPALAPKRSAGASVAAAWREQLGDGEAGSGRLPRGRAAQGGQVDWGVGSEGVRRGWAAVAMV